MRAWQLDGPGTTDAFRLVERPTPTAPDGHVVVAVGAFGLNRSELFSRRGMSSPDFTFPRVLGLECVGRVHDPGTTDLAAGERVMALMGGMGRSFDGSYATHTVVPRSQVFRIDSTLDDAVLGGIPETYNTAWGMVVENLGVTEGDRVLIRGGTSALGMAAGALARAQGASTVLGTTRNPAKRDHLVELGHYDAVILEGEGFATRVLDAAGPLSAVVECVGSTASVESSCATMPDGGRIALGGQLSESWDTDAAPRIPDGVTAQFTRSDQVASPRDAARMAAIIAGVQQGRWGPNTWETFPFADLPRAHGVMERNEAVGKLVVVV